MVYGERLSKANVLRMGNAVCRFQAISLENELTARVLSDGESRFQKRNCHSFLQ